MMKVAAPLLALTILLAGCGASRPCPAKSSLRSLNDGNTKSSVEFINFANEGLVVYWVNGEGEEIKVGDMSPEGDNQQQSWTNHVFRVRRHAVHSESEGDTEVVGDYKVTEGKQTFQVHPCGTMKRPDQGFDARSKEFEALSAHHATPCDPNTPSGQWSCFRCIERTDFDARPLKDFGFTKKEGKMSHRAEGEQTDTGYVEQIPFIRKVSKGPGYLRMNMTDAMKKSLLGWYATKKKEGKTVFDEVIPGGYTNSQRTPFGMINLDLYQDVRMLIMSEMHEVLQWWTNQSLRHTSTYGVRVYPREGMLINHVDREDTHLASAVLQVAQEVDRDGGWPLEVLQPNGLPCEVYMQPGEMVLYEGAWVKHGRPMRFKGDEFANVFTHFKPKDWDGTKEMRNKAKVRKKMQHKKSAQSNTDDDL